MNLRLLSKLLGIVAMLIGGAMLLCLPFALPELGYRRHLDYSVPPAFERDGARALIESTLISIGVGGILFLVGRGTQGRLFRKESLAVVGLSWVLGALPFYFAECHREPDERMSFVDCLFESQSGFSTTGATTISDLEDPELVPHCILFWRSMTHFLGGMGIIVLFVVILGQGSAGKALMRAEMPGPSKEGVTPRMQDTAWLFALVYCGLNAVLATILWLCGMSLFDALCHAFGTMATGGYSTYNASVGHFQSAVIEYVLIVFMLAAGTNFSLLYYLLAFKPAKLFRDVEWQTYAGLVVAIATLVTTVGLWQRDFGSVEEAVRYGLFQVVSIITTTGYGTHDLDQWSHVARGALFLLIFVGGCAGSTAGGLKVIRHILFLKVLRLEVEHSYRPNVVRTLRLGGRPVDDPELQRNILTYFALILAIFIFGWMFVVTLEPDATWGEATSNKLIDSASGVAATLNNIGPGLGTVGSTRNYGHFSGWSKMLFIWLMMLGRLEIFSILVLFAPGFWKSR